MRKKNYEKIRLHSHRTGHHMYTSLERFMREKKTENRYLKKILKEKVQDKKNKKKIFFKKLVF